MTDFRKAGVSHNDSSAVVTEGISKSFGPVGRKAVYVNALDTVTLCADHGEILGLIGPNGAGKTTLLKVLLGIIRPTSGKAYLSGIPVSDSASRERVGYLPEQPRFYPALSAIDILRLSGLLHGLRRREVNRIIDELISVFEMTGWAAKPVRHHSKGIIQRIGIAQALIHSPDILLLDEPGDGLDPAGRKLLRDLLLRFRASGATIIVSSHLLSEIEQISDRIAVIDRGVLVRTGKIDEIAPALGGYAVTLCDGVDVGANILHNFPFIIAPSGQSTIFVSTKDELQDLLRMLSDLQIIPEKIEPRESLLEDAFFSIIGRGTE